MRLQLASFDAVFNAVPILPASSGFPAASASK
jgi:hypothetical protein